ncbi:MAG: ribosome recycling factor [Phycisphaerales bacterium]|jgi:ribosome recycling factor|nr:ribosome recycling factor [Phycisphaerales bacterium]|tara:strand:+ start:1857 stop:2429 length:573 start_codon:yes stop_codon:yes gene_type:complete
MSTDPDTILMEAEEQMQKASEYLKAELKGIRAGRASPAMVEFIKVEYYGSSTDLKSLAVVSVPEATQLLIKPFDASSVGAIRTAIEEANLGVNPMVEDKQIRINIPSLTTDRRKQLVAQAKKVGEEQKVVMRNARRDANKHADSLAKQDGTHYSEDEISQLKDEIQELLKKYEGQIDTNMTKKSAEIMEV